MTNPEQLFVDGDIATIMGVRYKRIEENSIGHPLTDEIIRTQDWGTITEYLRENGDYGPYYDEDDMRAAADWQFREDVKAVEALLWVVFSGRGYSYDLINYWASYYLDMYKEGMRPEQEDN
jgi:hypothetical protein